VARNLSALAGFYHYGVHDAGVLSHSPVALVRRPRVADESSAIGLTTEELRRLLAAAASHSLALVSLSRSAAYESRKPSTLRSGTTAPTTATGC
jgi:site-specific recombinase XerD